MSDASGVLSAMLEHYGHTMGRTSLPNGLLNNVCLTCRRLRDRIAPKRGLPCLTRFVSICDRLHRLPTWARLALRGGSNLTTDRLSQVLRLSGHNMVALDVGCCSSLSANALLGISKDSCLQFLSVDGCDISDDAMVHVASCSPQLHTLNLAFCGSLSDRALDAIAFHCPALTSINMKRCKFTDGAIIRLAEQCRRLTSINMKGIRCAHETLECVVSSCKLRSLSVDASHQVMMYVAQYCPELVSLDVSMGASETDIMQVARSCRNLKQLCVPSSGRLPSTSDWLSEVKALLPNCHVAR